MKVTVIKPLNVRVGTPSVNAPCYQYITPGSELEVDGQLYSGDAYDNINTWYKDGAGNYYWSGGVIKPITSLTPVANETSAVTYPTNLRELVKLNGDYPLSSLGSSGVVAVLDSGITNSLLKARINLEKNFVGNQVDTSDIYGHGTKVAGIICGNGPIIKSFASLCSIINYRVADENGVITSDPVYNALDTLNKLNPQQAKVDVINLSFDTPSNLVSYMQPIIDGLANKGIVAVVAAGNGDTLNNIASLQNVIKVGAIKKDDFNSIKEKGLNKIYDCAFIDTPILSTSNKDKYDEIGQASAYTALISSMICAFLKDASNSQLQGRQRLATIKQFLTNCSFAISDEYFPQNFKPLKR